MSHRSLQPVQGFFVVIQDYSRAFLKTDCDILISDVWRRTMIMILWQQQQQHWKLKMTLTDDSFHVTIPVMQLLIHLLLAGQVLQLFSICMFLPTNAINTCTLQCQRFSLTILVFQVKPMVCCVSLCVVHSFFACRGPAYSGHHGWASLARGGKLVGVWGVWARCV